MVSRLKSRIERIAAITATRTGACILALLFSPLLMANHVDFRWRVTRNPLYRSRLTKAAEVHPRLYTIIVYAWNFPQFDRVYEPLPALAGTVGHIGCGTGLMNRYWNRRRGHLRTWFINIDLSRQYLRYGARSVCGASLQGDANRLPLRNSSCDAIVYARSFHHMRHPRKVLAEAGRVLKPGGVVVIIDPVSLGDSDASARVVNTSIDGLIWRYSKEGLQQLLSKSLPTCLTIKSISTVRQYNVTNWNPWWPHADAIAILEHSRPTAREQETDKPPASHSYNGA